MFAWVYFFVFVFCVCFFFFWWILTEFLLSFFFLTLKYFLGLVWFKDSLLSFVVFLCYTLKNVKFGQGYKFVIWIEICSGMNSTLLAVWFPAGLCCILPVTGTQPHFCLD